MTNLQVKLIHTAAKQAELDDGAYRLLLHNVAGVESCTQLSNAQFEDVMAVIEDKAASMSIVPSIGRTNYWRTKSARSGQFANDRLLNRIHELARSAKYPLNGLVKRLTQGRTGDVRLISPHEAHDLIEALKEIAARTTENVPA